MQNQMRQKRKAAADFILALMKSQETFKDAQTKLDSYDWQKWFREEIGDMEAE